MGHRPDRRHRQLRLWTRPVGISLAYVVKGEVRVSVVHAPFQGETFVAVRGGGAALNGRPLEARATVQLADALISTGFPHDHADMKNILARLGCVMAVSSKLVVTCVGWLRQRSTSAGLPQGASTPPTKPCGPGTWRRPGSWRGRWASSATITAPRAPRSHPSCVVTTSCSHVPGSSSNSSRCCA